MLVAKTAVNLNLAIPKAILTAAQHVDPELNENEEQRQLRLDILSDRTGNLGDFIEYEFDAPVKRVTYLTLGEAF